MSWLEEQLLALFIVMVFSFRDELVILKAGKDTNTFSLFPLCHERLSALESEVKCVSLAELVGSEGGKGGRTTQPL